MAQNRNMPQMQPNQNNIINQVVLGLEAAEVWMSAMADVARVERMKQNSLKPIVFSNETAILLPDGSLSLRIKVNEENMTMDVPSGMWSMPETPPSKVLPKQ